MSPGGEEHAGQLAGLHPDLTGLLHTVPDYQPGDVDRARRLMAQSMGGSHPQPEEVLLVRADDREIEVRVHRPAAGGSGGAILFIHGGGFFMGSAALYDGVCHELASITGCAILAVDYRLAPENPFPAGLDDCYAAWVALTARPESLRIDPGRLGIYGESAGAALAVGVAHRLLSSGEQLPALLVLQEPVIDDRLERDSSRYFTATPIWNRRLAEWSWDIYLRDVRSNPPAETSPARLDSFAGLPATFISTRDLDPLRDEGLEFARRLIDDGVPVDLRHYAGSLHGTLGFIGTKLRDRVLRDAAEFVSERLAGPA